MNSFIFLLCYIKFNNIVFGICNWSKWSENIFNKKCKCLGREYSNNYCGVNFRSDFCKVPKCSELKNWCPWMTWSSWSTFCNDGQRRRKRQCCDGYLSSINFSSPKNFYPGCLNVYEDPLSFTNRESRYYPCFNKEYRNNFTINKSNKRNLRYTLIPIIVFGMSIFFLLFIIQRFCKTFRERNLITANLVLTRNMRNIRNISSENYQRGSRIINLPLLYGGNSNVTSSNNRISEIQDNLLNSNTIFENNLFHQRCYDDPPPSYNSLNKDSTSIPPSSPPPSYNSCMN